MSPLSDGESPAGAGPSAGAPSPGQRRHQPSTGRRLTVGLPAAPRQRRGDDGQLHDRDARQGQVAAQRRQRQHHADHQQGQDGQDRRSRRAGVVNEQVRKAAVSSPPRRCIPSVASRSVRSSCSFIGHIPWSRRVIAVTNQTRPVRPAPAPGQRSSRQRSLQEGCFSSALLLAPRSLVQSGAPPFDLGADQRACDDPLCSRPRGCDDPAVRRVLACDGPPMRSAGAGP
jgi:hypothetical protein